MSTLGRYEVRDRLGRGGFATVFRGWDPLLKREVALKALSIDWAEDADVRRRFVLEAQALASLRHEHIVTVYDVGDTPDRPFFVMELLDGITLEQRLAGGARLDLPEVLSVAAPLAAALDTLHAAGLVHRDVKAANVMLTSSRRTVLMDLGIARVLDGPALTSKSIVMLSPESASPEQIRGQTVGQSSDIYSLGVVIYQMLAGRPPFVGQTAELLHKHVYEPPPPLWEMRPGLPPVVYAVIDEALAKDPTRRPKSAGAVAAALRTVATVSHAPAPEEVPPARSAPSPAPVAAARPAAPVAPAPAGGTQSAWDRPAREGRLPPPPPSTSPETIAAPAAAAPPHGAGPRPSFTSSETVVAGAPVPPPPATVFSAAMLGPLAAAGVLWLAGVFIVLWMLTTGRLEDPYPLLVLAPGPALAGLVLPVTQVRRVALWAGAALLLATLGCVASALWGEFGEPDGTMLTVVLITVVPVLGGLAVLHLPNRESLLLTALTLAVGVLLWRWVYPQQYNGPVSTIDVLAFVAAQLPLAGLVLVRAGGGLGRVGMAAVLPWLSVLVMLVPVLAVVD